MLRLFVSQSQRESILVTDAGKRSLVDELARLQVKNYQLRDMGGPWWTAHLKGDRHLLVSKKFSGIRATFQELAQFSIQLWAARHSVQFHFGRPVRLAPPPSRAVVERELRHVQARLAL